MLIQQQLETATTPKISSVEELGTVPVSDEDINESEPDDLIFENDDSAADIDDDDTMSECSESSHTAKQNTIYY